MNPAQLADLIVVVHLGIVLFVVLGLVLILVGGALGWRWVRNPWFRLAHFAVIVFVAVQGAGFDAICPLTTWENELRRRAGQEGYEGSFVGKLCHDVLFVDASQAVLNWCYVGFATLVLLALVLVRPRRPRRARA